MRLVRPFAFGARHIQAVSADELAALRGDMLGEFQQETHHWKGLGLSLEELVLGGEGNHGAVSILLEPSDQESVSPYC